MTVSYRIHKEEKWNNLVAWDVDVAHFWASLGYA